MSDWQKVPFDSLFLAPTRNGIYKTAEFHGRGTKIVNMGELFANDRIGKQSMERIELTEQEKRISLLEEGDLLFARRSLVESGAGKAAIVTKLPEETTFESSVIRVRLNQQKCNPLFYLYWLRSYNGRSAIMPLVTGVNVKGIRGSDLAKIMVDYPTIEIQNRIASFLSDYDDLIETNQYQIELLEEAAQRLYKEWFVDLRYPGHENVPVVDGVPEGWKKEKLLDIAPVLTGKRDANFGTPDGEYMFFTCAQEAIKAPSYSFDCDAVILAGNGDFNVKLFRGRFEAYQRTYVLSPYEQKNLYLLFHAVRESMRQLFQGASGSTIKFLTKHMLDEIPVWIPNSYVMDSFNRNCESIQSKSECLKQQMRDAKEARDRLLPKLMSGEIAV